MHFSIPSAISLTVLAILGSSEVTVEARPDANSGHHLNFRRATTTSSKCVPATTTKMTTLTFTKTVTASPTGSSTVKTTTSSVKPITTSTVKPATTSIVKPTTTSSVKPATTTSTVKPPTTSTPSKATGSASPTVSKRSATTSSAVKKAGLAYNWEFNQNWPPWTDTADSKISWGYSWDAHPMLNFPTSRLNFVPMLHGNAADKIQWFQSQIPNFPGWGVTHLLSFNEPDMSGDVGGSNITPVQAAIDHQRVFNSTVSSKYKIGAPAVARGSKAWLQQWIAACNGKCKYDFIPIHFYGRTPQELYDYVGEMYATFGKPLWITEFAAMDFPSGYSATAAEAQAFQNAVIPFLESTSMVERYSWFGLFSNWNNGNALLNSDGSVNALGKFYMTK